MSLAALFPANKAWKMYQTMKADQIVSQERGIYGGSSAEFNKAYKSPNILTEKEINYIKKVKKTSKKDFSGCLARKGNFSKDLANELSNYLGNDWKVFYADFPETKIEKDKIVGTGEYTGYVFQKKNVPTSPPRGCRIFLWRREGERYKGVRRYVKPVVV